MPRRTSWLWLLGALACCLLGGAGVHANDFFPLVDGSKQAVIVGRSAFLRDAILRCTGRTLRETPEDKAEWSDDEYPIYVGDSKAAGQAYGHLIDTLDAEGFLFIVEPTRAFIYSPRPTTNTYALQAGAEATFARKFMGVDQYFPGPLGGVYPQATELRIPCGVYIEQPAFKHRQWSGYAGAAGPAWRVRASGGPGRQAFHHNFFRIMPAAKYAAEHPDYYPVIIPRHGKPVSKGIHSHLKPGERYLPSGRAAAYWQPCTSNPAVLDLVVNAVIAHFEKNPQAESFSLAVNDGGGFCLCDQCLADTPSGMTPDSRAAKACRMIGFYNRVAQRVAARCPHVRLGFLVYDELAHYLPDKLHPTLQPYLTLSMADRFNPAYRDRQDAFIRQWGQVASRLGIYEWMQGDGFLIPRIYVHGFAEGLREARKAGADGFYAEGYVNWGLDGPKMWIAERLLWEPDLEVDALLDQWCQGLFGRASSAMRAYFDFLEKAWAAGAADQPVRSLGGYRLLGVEHAQAQLTQVFPSAVCDQAWALLNAADDLADSDEARQRIDYFRSTFGLTRLASQRHHAARVADQVAAALAPDDLDGRLKALEPWASLETLDTYASRLRQAHPTALHAFNADQIRIRRGEIKAESSFAAWDATPRTLHAAVHLAKGLIENARAYDEAGAIQAIQAALPWASSSPHAVSLIARQMTQAYLRISPLTTTPVIDGRIEPQWGQPVFDGAFMAYPHENQPAAERTQVWAGIVGNHLYVAMRCHQDAPARSDITGRDAVLLNDQRRIVEPLPHFTRGDSVGLILQRPSRFVMVTPAGGLLDAEGNHGLAVDWNGVTSAVSQDDQGWSMELMFDLGPLKDVSELKINFIRVTDGRRSAWIAGEPDRWAMSPRRVGILLLTHPNQ